MARKREAAPVEAPSIPLAPGAQIARLALAPGDILAVTLDRSIATRECADALRDYVAPLLPAGVKCLILDDRAALSVLKPETP